VRAARSRRTFLRYLAFQVPGWTLGLLVAALLLRAGWVEPWLAASFLGLLVAVDLALFPRVRRAYEPDRAHDHLRLDGARAVALEALVPGREGWVQVGPERWRARIAPGRPAVAPGQAVRVLEVRALTLVVAPDS
jgi:membrane protein implicated in regulation of membrane protease activity